MTDLSDPRPAPTAAALPATTLEILRCQQTLGSLVPQGGGLFSPAAGLLYPIRDGIVYMGYDERDHDFMQRVIDAERIHQATPSAIEPSFEFLRTSSLSVIDLIRLLRKRIDADGTARGLELGAGSGWASWLFAEAGFDMWICELEPNSLALGQIYDHPRLGAGRRIACDATLVPFADGSFDFVLCKEFAHHVLDKKRLFREANRVLRRGGVLVLLDPVLCLTDLVRKSHPDTIPEHAFSWTHEYLRTSRSSGFDVLEHGALSLRRARRVPFAATAAARASEERRRGSLAHDFLTMLYLQLVGGELVLIAAKTREAPRLTRPRVRVIDPAILRVSSLDRPSFAPFKRLLEERASNCLTGAGSL